MKIAICISGHIRDFYKNIDSFLINFINPLEDNHEVDIFLSTWSDLFFQQAIPHVDQRDKAAIITNAQLNYKNSYDYVRVIKPKMTLIEKYEGLMQKFLPKAFFGEREREREYFQNQKRYHGFNERHLEWAASMFYKIWSANDLKSNYEKSHNFKYDVVFRARPDLIFLKSAFNLGNTSLEKDTINTYKKCNSHYSEIIDLFYWGDSESMDKICTTHFLMKDMVLDNVPFYGNENILGLTALHQNLKINVVDGVNVDRYR